MLFQYHHFKKVGAGLLLLSLGIGGLYYLKNSRSKKITPLAEPLTNQKLNDIIKRCYPTCAIEMRIIYNAIGLTPLLRHKIETNPDESSLTIVNRTLQAILLRPPQTERQDLKDTAYLERVTQKLKEAYQAEQLPAPPPINTQHLHSLLSDPAIWSSSQAKPNIPFDAALLFGCTYHNYLNRQSFFWDLRKDKMITLSAVKGQKFPVYLLSRDRPLTEIIDPSLERCLRNQAKTEQNMMNALFAVYNRITVQTGYCSLEPLQAIPINSPQIEGRRSTTASTLKAFIEKYQLKKAQSKTYLLAISSAPFTRYQDLVTRRVFLANGLDSNAVEVVTLGPDMQKQMQDSSELTSENLIAICLDTLAREIYEHEAIAHLDPKLNKTKKPT